MRQKAHQCYTGFPNPRALRIAPLNDCERNDKKQGELYQGGTSRLTKVIKNGTRSLHPLQYDRVIILGFRDNDLGHYARLVVELDAQVGTIVQA